MEMTNDFILKLLTLIVLFVTMVFVMMYWAETQQMKKEMINQNKIAAQSLKASLLPALDVQFETVKADPGLSHFKIEFAYDIFIENKGNGPAFDVTVQRLIVTEKNKQKMAIKSQPQSKLEHFSKKIHMIGRGERVKLYREHSGSFEYVKITVLYRDHFKDLHKSVFEGDRDGLILKDYPVLQEYQNIKRGNIDES